jgi:hypothetical protein
MYLTSSGINFFNYKSNIMFTVKILEPTAKCKNENKNDSKFYHPETAAIHILLECEYV